MRGQELTLYEREKLELHSRSHDSLRCIAKMLHRDHSVLVRELQRNTCSDGRYRAAKAHEYAERRKQRKRKGKLEDDEDLKLYVIKMIFERLSPKQISGLLKNRLEPKMDGKGVSHETIYQFIYEGAGRHLGLYQHLRRKHKKRHRLFGRKRRDSKGILYMTPLIYRSEEIQEKQVFGHWESDSMIFRKQQQILSVQYERSTQLVHFRRLANKTADATEQTLRELIERGEQGPVHSLTFDRGTEGATHWKLRLEYGVDTFHCDAYSSWQKGGVENMNGLIRQYLPLHTDLSLFTDHDLYVIQEQINDRPREGLGYQSPNQLLKKLFPELRRVVH